MGVWHGPPYSTSSLLGSEGKTFGDSTDELPGLFGSAKRIRRGLPGRPQGGDEVAPKSLTRVKTYAPLFPSFRPLKTQNSQKTGKQC